MVHSSPNGLNNEERVSSLIDPLLGRWKGDVLDECFDLVEAERIGRLVPSPLSGEDCMIWRGTKHGCFMVCSAYFLELERRATKKGENSRKIEQQSFWKSLWSLSIPPVVMNFV
jgi:hypothetical protein